MRGGTGLPSALKHPELDQQSHQQLLGAVVDVALRAGAAAMSWARTTCWRDTWSSAARAATTSSSRARSTVSRALATSRPAWWARSSSSRDLGGRQRDPRRCGDGDARPAVHPRSESASAGPGSRRTGTPPGAGSAPRGARRGPVRGSAARLSRRVVGHQPQRGARWPGCCPPRRGSARSVRPPRRRRRTGRRAPHRVPGREPRHRRRAGCTIAGPRRGPARRRRPR